VTVAVVVNFEEIPGAVDTLGAFSSGTWPFLTALDISKNIITAISNLLKDSRGPQWAWPRQGRRPRGAGTRTSSWPTPTRRGTTIFIFYLRPGAFFCKPWQSLHFALYMFGQSNTLMIPLLQIL
jgi:hypothetical protein